jgi:hypothetical protein
MTIDKGETLIKTTRRRGDNVAGDVNVDFGLR